MHLPGVLACGLRSTVAVLDPDRPRHSRSTRAQSLQITDVFEDGTFPFLPPPLIPIPFSPVTSDAVDVSNQSTEVATLGRNRSASTISTPLMNTDVPAISNHARSLSVLDSVAIEQF